MIDLDAFKGFTPGPWEHGYLDRNGQRVVRQEHIEICTCWHHSVGSIEIEMENNARLIAAAPDLLSLAREQRAELKMLRALIDDLRRGEEG